MQDQVARSKDYIANKARKQTPPHGVEHLLESDILIVHLQQLLSDFKGQSNHGGEAIRHTKAHQILLHKRPVPCCLGELHVHISEHGYIDKVS